MDTTTKTIVFHFVSEHFTAPLIKSIVNTPYDDENARNSEIDHVDSAGSELAAYWYEVAQEGGFSGDLPKWKLNGNIKEALIDQAHELTLNENVLDKYTNWVRNKRLG